MIPFDALGAVDSTSREAARRAGQGDFGPVWLWADTQTAGRGRSGREWESPPGNLYATLLMPVGPDPAAAALRSFVACLAVADTLDALVGNPARISLKWPNDALLDGCKIAGVLLESGVVSGARWLSVGIGINLAHAPAEARWPAISIAQAVPGAAPGVEGTLALLRDAFARRDALFQAEGFAAIQSQWLKRAARLGQEIEARLPRETITGIFETLDDDGALLLQAPHGPRRITAADIHFSE